MVTFSSRSCAKPGKFFTSEWHLQPTSDLRGELRALRSLTLTHDIGQLQCLRQGIVCVLVFSNRIVLDLMIFFCTKSLFLSQFQSYRFYLSRIPLLEAEDPGSWFFSTKNHKSGLWLTCSQNFNADFEEGDLRISMWGRIEKTAQRLKACPAVEENWVWFLVPMPCSYLELHGIWDSGFCGHLYLCAHTHTAHPQTLIHN